ncbi:Uma2 family endonuclease, partial [Candidatus Entotheonella palauensis]
MATAIDEALEQLLASPRLPLYAQRIGDVLAREAQQRQDFYAQLNDGYKAEFINGQVIYHSPVKLKHNRAAKRLLTLLDAHVQEHELGYVGFEKILISLTRNDYEPDICFFDHRKASLFAPDQMRFPGPDFVVEVLSESTAERDRGIKFDDYAAHAVSEYWIVDPEHETVEQYRLAGQDYDLVEQYR